MTGGRTAAHSGLPFGSVSPSRPTSTQRALMARPAALAIGAQRRSGPARPGAGTVMMGG
jgi:hypothetical protein